MKEVFTNDAAGGEGRNVAKVFTKADMENYSKYKYRFRYNFGSFNFQNKPYILQQQSFLSKQGGFAKRYKGLSIYNIIH